ncbi:MAG TPA: DUF2752 domain-containing protein [Blastocatellia bacterium]|nr:DUF2752 domain-containing protein [Blastocatellia bacterium]
MSSLAQTELPVERYSRKLAALTVAGLSLVFLASIVFRPRAVGPFDDYFTICGFKNLTGLPCPGCGLTHSFCALGKGDLLSAVAFNALGPLLFLALALIWVRAALVLANNTEAVAAIDKSTWRFKLVRNFVIAFGVFGLARIIYIILVVRPASVSQSPLMRLIARLFG